MPIGPEAGVGMANSVITPEVVIRPILFPNRSVNQTLPVRAGKNAHRSALLGWDLELGDRARRGHSGNLVRSVLGEPHVPVGAGNDPRASGLPGILNSVIVPFGVIRATLLLFDSVNHTFPSEPAAIPLGKLFGVGTAIP